MAHIWIYKGIYVYVYSYICYELGGLGCHSCWVELNAGKQMDECGRTRNRRTEHHATSLIHLLRVLYTNSATINDSWLPVAYYFYGLRACSALVRVHPRANGVLRLVKLEQSRNLFRFNHSTFQNSFSALLVLRNYSLFPFVHEIMPPSTTDISK